MKNIMQNFTAERNSMKQEDNRPHGSYKGRITHANRPVGREALFLATEFSLQNLEFLNKF